MFFNRKTALRYNGKRVIICQMRLFVYKFQIQAKVHL